MSLPALRSLFASFGATLCGAGLVLGALFVAASLMPTLVPRSPYLQGALSGLCFAVGYGLGWALRGLWRAFELPEASGRMRRRTLMVAGTVCGLTIVMAMWWHVVWQNRLRALMQLPDLNTSGLLAMTVIAVVVFVLLLVTVRLFTRLKRALARRFKRRLPPEPPRFWP
nr:alpha/beta-hydrolase N-terminal domain-containing protein [Diaphorobacter aerolatus]